MSGRRLCLTALAMGFTIAAAGPAGGPRKADAAQLRQVTERVFPFEPGGIVTIESQNGRVTVEAWDRPEARIQITRVVRASSDRNAVALMKELRADVTVFKGHISIESRHPKRVESVGLWDLLGQRVTSLNIHYYVQVPIRTGLVLETSNGELQVRGITGELIGQTVNGNVELTSIIGPVRVNTTNGSIRMTGLQGSARAGTTNGGVAAEMRRLASGGKVELTTTNGDVTASLPADVQATVDAVTTNGRVSVGYPLQRLGAATSRSVQGRIGGGGAAVTLRTTNGNILIRKVGEGRRR